MIFKLIIIRFILKPASLKQIYINERVYILHYNHFQMNKKAADRKSPFSKQKKEGIVDPQIQGTDGGTKKVNRERQRQESIPRRQTRSVDKAAKKAEEERKKVEEEKNENQKKKLIQQRQPAKKTIEELKGKVLRLQELQNKGKEIIQKYKKQQVNAELQQEFRIGVKQVKGEDYFVQREDLFKANPKSSYSWVLQHLLSDKQRYQVELKSQQKQFSHSSEELKRLLDIDFYDSQQIDFQKYKQFIKDYQKYGDVVKVRYDPDDPQIEPYLFQWVDQENKVFQESRKTKIQNLQREIEKQKDKEQKVAQLTKNINILKEYGPGLVKEYKKDVRELLEGGFLINIDKIQYKRLVADLLSYGYAHRCNNLLDNYEIDKIKYNYTQATIKESCLSKEYLQGAKEVFQSVVNSSQLTQCFSFYLKNYGGNSPTGEITQQRVTQGIKQAKDNILFFDYDYPLNGITICKERVLQICFNTYKYHSQRKSKLRLFKSFIFFTFIHQLVHYLIRYLNLTRFQEKSLGHMNSSEKEDFRKVLNIKKPKKTSKKTQQKTYQETKFFSESGDMFERYLSGSRWIYVEEGQYENFLEAEKNGKKILKHFHKIEQKKLKERRDLHDSGLVHLFRKHSNEIMLLSKEMCGTHTLGR